MWAPYLWLLGSRTQAQLWPMGLVAPQHVGSSQTMMEPVSPALAGGFFTTGDTRETLKESFGEASKFYTNFK